MADMSTDTGKKNWCKICSKSISLLWGGEALQEV